jgi:hypothetical protein
MREITIGIAGAAGMVSTNPATPLQRQPAGSALRYAYNSYQSVIRRAYLAVCELPKKRFAHTVMN